MLTRIAIVLLLAGLGTAHAERPRLWHQAIEKPDVALRGRPAVLGAITIGVAAPGNVIVEFDGYGVISVGDRIVLAASDVAGWSGADGSVGIEAYNADQDERPFSHTRSYAVPAGEHTFYAVGQNWVEQDGTGIASIFGSLIVKYYPDHGDAAPFSRHTGIQVIDEDLRGAPVNLAELTITTAAAGNVLVRFDGTVISSPGDRIVLAANDLVAWEIDSGNVAVEAADNDLDTTSFSHSRVFEVLPGTHSFHAVGHNFAETSGTGHASVFGSLTVEFAPASGADDVAILQVPVGSTDTDFNSAPVVLAEMAAFLPVAMKGLVRFDALGFADVGDQLVFAASDFPDWKSEGGVVGVEAVNTDINSMPFSVSWAYNKPEGSHGFFAVGENWIERDGNGFGSVYGHLTLHLFNNDEMFGDGFE